MSVAPSGALVPALTAEQDRFLRQEAARPILIQTQPQAAFPVAGVAIAAAAWCAKGALASIPTSVLSDILAGRASSRTTYVRNAVIGCLGGEIGGWAWRVLPGWVKDRAIKMVIAFIIKYVR